MKKFSIRVLEDLDIWYNHYLSDKFIKEEECHGYFKEGYPLLYFSRRFDKPAVKDDGACFWWLDDKRHRVGKPAMIWSNGRVLYYENGKRVK